MNINDVIVSVRGEIYNNLSGDYTNQIDKLNKYVLSQEPNNFDGLILMGQIYYITMDYKKSEEYYLKALNVKIDSFVLYGLFKIYIKNKEYQKAYDMFCEYTEFCERIDSDLVKSLLLFINSNLKEKSKVLNYISNNDYYTELVNYYNDGDYNNCINYAKKYNIDCKTKCVKSNGYVIVELFYDLKEKIFNEITEEDIKELGKEKKYDELFNLFRYYIYRVNENRDKIKTIIFLLRKQGYATKMYEALNNIVEKGYSTVTLDRLIKYCKEDSIICNYDEDLKMTHDYAILKGKYYVNIKRDYETAYDIFSYGYYYTNNPLFLYQMAKCLTKLKLFDEAVELFNDYLKKGSIKAQGSLDFINKIKSYER